MTKVLCMAMAASGLIFGSSAKADRRAPPAVVASETIAFAACDASEPATSVCLTLTGTTTFPNGATATYTRDVILAGYSDDAVGGCDGVARTKGRWSASGRREALEFEGVGTYCKSAVGDREAGSGQYVLQGTRGPGGRLVVSGPSQSFTDTATFNLQPPEDGAQAPDNAAP